MFTDFGVLWLSFLDKVGLHLLIWVLMFECAMDEVTKELWRVKVGAADTYNFNYIARLKHKTSAKYLWDRAICVGSTSNRVLGT